MKHSDGQAGISGVKVDDQTFKHACIVRSNVLS